VLALYRRFQHEPWVQADRTFLRVLECGPPDRPAAKTFEQAAATA
jgi:hypothetical protein